MRRYKIWLNDLFDRISKDVTILTGQREPPKFLIIQAPGKGSRGAWPNLQAQVEVSQARVDTHLALSGWAVPQHDRTHFSNVGAVNVGEICAHVAYGIDTGNPCGAPYIENLIRNGCNIIAEIGGPHDVIVDIRSDSPRHCVDGKPVPFYGFTAHGADILLVEVESRHINITMSTAVPITLSYAYFGGRGRLPPNGDRRNQSVNRGTIRADWAKESMLSDHVLYQWLALGTWKI